MFSKLLENFRRTNARLNERLFRTEANTFLPYLAWIDRRLPATGVIVDLGAGAVALQGYLPRVGADSVLPVAVDGNFSGLEKHCGRHKVVAQAEALPFGDETVDVVAASCVFEHIEDPAGTLAECYRVLKKGGSLVFYTPNRRSYVAVMARLTPLFFHRWVRRLQIGKEPLDVEVCKTYYKLNTRCDILRFGKGFHVLSLETHIGAPSYSTFSPPPVHFVFIAFHKMVQRIAFLRRSVGESIIGCLVKPEMR